MKLFLMVLFVVQVDLKDEREICVAKILASKSFLRVSYVNLEDFYVEDVRNTSFVNVKLKGDLGFVKKLRRQELYLVQTCNSSSIEGFLKVASKGFAWDSSVNTLVTGCVGISQIFELTWRYYLMNVVVISQDLNVYTYYPVTGNQCKAPKVVWVCQCSDFHGGFGVFNESTRSFKGCKFKSAFFFEPPWHINWTHSYKPGIFEEIDQLLQYRLGFETQVFNNYSEDSYGVQLANGEYSGMLGDLYEGIIDYFMGNFGNGTYQTDFDLSPHYFTCDYKFWAPAATTSHIWKNLVLIFSLKVWLCLATSLLLLFLSTSVLSLKEVGHFSEYLYAVLIYWRILFSFNNFMPQSTQYKLLIILWTFCSFILTSSYQGYMDSILFLPRYDQQIDTVEKLLESDLEFGGSNNPKATYQALQTPIARRIVDRYVLCKGHNTNCVERAVHNQDFVVIKDIMVMSYNWPKYLDRMGRPKLFSFQSEVHYPYVIYFRKGHPLTKRVQHISLDLLEYGFIQKIFTNYGRVTFTQVSSHLTSLSLQHLLLAFVLITCGLALCGIVFVFEVLYLL